MEPNSIKEIIEQNKTAKFPCGICCSGERCADCRYIDMANNMYNDGTRHCREMGRWVRPSDPACHYFKW